MSLASPLLIRYSIAVAGLLFSFVFSFLWILDFEQAWIICYISSITFSILFFVTHRKNLISLTGLFVGISFIAITLPAIPYLVFDLEARDGFLNSIFLNSLGQLYFVTIALFVSPCKSLYCANSTLFVGSCWRRFVRVNRTICLITLPFVLLTVTKAGAWGYLFGDRSGDFDRIASMKGLGPLMIFSVVNVMAVFFWVSGIWFKGDRCRAFVTAMLFLFLNGFTGGRQNYIAFFFGSLIFYVSLIGFDKRLFLVGLGCGILIVLMKELRNYGVDNILDTPWYVNFFLQFAGDFDSLNNNSVLIEYIRQHGYFGLYHIWSNILIYLPRDLFPWKSHDLGGLYLNKYLFPGVYLGAEGGTGLGVGFQGIWYAAYGLGTLVIGNFLLSISLAWADRHLYQRIHHQAPGVFLVAYIFLAGQSIIIYRDGFLAFLNVGLYVTIYWIIFKICLSTVNENANLGSPRSLEAQ